MAYPIISKFMKVGPLNETKRAEMLSIGEEMKSCLQQLENTELNDYHNCLVKNGSKLVEQYKTEWLKDGQIWTLLDEVSLTNSTTSYFTISKFLKA